MCWEDSQNVTHNISIIAFPPVTRHTPMYIYMYNNYYDNPNVEFMLYRMLMVLYYLIIIIDVFIVVVAIWDRPDYMCRWLD